MLLLLFRGGTTSSIGLCRQSRRRAATAAATVAAAGAETLYGIHPVWQALLAGRRRIDRLYVDSRRRLESGSQAAWNPSSAGLLELIAERHSGLVSYVDRHVLSAMCNGRSHQGFAMRCGPFPVPVLASGCEELAAFRLCVLIDQVVDVLNFASLLRTCLFYGAAPVLVPRLNCSPPLPLVSKVSCGAMEATDLRALPCDTEQFVRLWRRAGWLALASSGGCHDNAGGCHDNAGGGDVSIAVGDLRLRLPPPPSAGPVLLLLGSESFGLSPRVLAGCDRVLRIPAAAAAAAAAADGGMPHLNVAVAAGVLLHCVTEWLRTAA